MSRILAPLMLLAVAVAAVLAQTTQPSAKPKPAAAAVSGDASSSDVEEQRKALFAGQRWARIVEGIRQWASSTQVYTPEQIEEIRQHFNDRLRNQTPAEIEKSMAQMEKWLGVMLSPEAREANAHIAQTLQLQSEQAAQRTRDKLPNVAFMTATELQQELLSFNQQRQANAATAAAFNQARNQQIQMTQQSMAAQRQAQQQANLAARRTAAARPAFQSPLSPPTPTTRIDRSNNSSIFIDNWGRAGVVFGGHRW